MPRVTTTAFMEFPATGHDPVLLTEVLLYLDPKPGQIVIDCTTGRGGHSLAISQKLGNDGTLIALDADPRNLEYAQERLKAAPCTVRLFHANFAELADVLKEVGAEKVNGILADLGISTNQLFQEEYGMSFSQPMPLDMRIDPRTRQSAADIVNTWKEAEIADILYQLANERFSRKIARKIVEARRNGPILTTERLADIVRTAIGPRGGAPEKIDPATRTFMALRMAVNQELENLDALLRVAPERLAEGGRLGIISFHSGEDRLVKQAFRALDERGTHNVLTKKPIEPSDDEIHRNPRARSAKLRVVEKGLRTED